MHIYQAVKKRRNMGFMDTENKQLKHIIINLKATQIINQIIGVL